MLTPPDVTQTVQCSSQVAGKEHSTPFYETITVCFPGLWKETQSIDDWRSDHRCRVSIQSHQRLPRQQPQTGHYRETPKHIVVRADELVTSLTRQSKRQLMHDCWVEKDGRSIIDPADQALFQIVGMGFTAIEAREALMRTDNGVCHSVPQAIEYLLHRSALTA